MTHLLRSKPRYWEKTPWILWTRYRKLELLTGRSLRISTNPSLPEWTVEYCDFCNAQESTNGSRKRPTFLCTITWCCLPAFSFSFSTCVCEIVASRMSLLLSVRSSPLFVILSIEEINGSGFPYGSSSLLSRCFPALCRSSISRASSRSLYPCTLSISTESSTCSACTISFCRRSHPFNHPRKRLTPSFVPTNNIQ